MPILFRSGEWICIRQRRFSQGLLRRQSRFRSRFRLASHSPTTRLAMWIRRMSRARLRASPRPDSSVDTTGVTISKNGDAAEAENSSFAIGDFSRAQKARTEMSMVNTTDTRIWLGAMRERVRSSSRATSTWSPMCPKKIARDLDIDLTSPADQASLKAMFVALDAGQAAGSKTLSSFDTWYFTSDKVFEKVPFASNSSKVSDKTYVFVIGVDGSDLTDSENEKLFQAFVRRFWLPRSEGRRRY